jgi:hypothetical protein
MTCDRNARAKIVEWEGSSKLNWKNLRDMYRYRMHDDVDAVIIYEGGRVSTSTIRSCMHDEIFIVGG